VVTTTVVVTTMAAQIPINPLIWDGHPGLALLSDLPSYSQLHYSFKKLLQ